jgi:hypothetical protein
MYTLDSSYNDGCNCHPEYQEVFEEVDTLKDLALATARSEHGRWSVKREDISVRRPLTDEEWEIFTEHLKDARIRVTLEKETVKRAEAKKKELNSLITRRMGLKRQLETLRSELTPDAIAGRQAVLDHIQTEIDHLASA